MGITRLPGRSLDNEHASFMRRVGTITTFLFFIILSAYDTQDDADIPLRAKTTFATALNCVSTGPGHSTPI